MVPMAKVIAESSQGETQATVYLKRYILLHDSNSLFLKDLQNGLMAFPSVGYGESRLAPRVHQWN